VAAKKDGDQNEATTDEERRAKMLKTGIGIGIGSAAIVAALLYANQSRKKKLPAKLDD
jgi:homoserine kinase